MPHTNTAREKSSNNWRKKKKNSSDRFIIDADWAAWRPGRTINANNPLLCKMKPFDFFSVSPVFWICDALNFYIWALCLNWSVKLSTKWFSILHFGRKKCLFCIFSFPILFALHNVVLDIAMHPIFLRFVDECNNTCRTCDDLEKCAANVGGFACTKL